MGRMKDYMMELAEKKGVDFFEIIQKDIEEDFMIKAQAAFTDKTTSKEDLENWKEYLPHKSESEAPNHKKNQIFEENGVFYLVK